MMFAPLVVCLFAASSDGTPTLDEFYTRFTENRRLIVDLRAEFVQKTVTPDEIYTSEGTIVYKRPRRIIFRYPNPETGFRSAYMIDDGLYYEYDEEIEQLSVYEISDRPEAEGLFAGFENNLDVLQDAYTIRLLQSDPAWPDTLGVELVPKNVEPDDAIFQSITLQLRQEDFLPVAITIVNDEESSVHYTVSGFAVNEGLSEELTHLNVPEETTILHNDEPAGTVGVEGLMLPSPDSAGPVAQDDLDTPGGESKQL